jgi:hypothetical protein
MNQRERQAYLLSQGDDDAHMSESGFDNADIRAAMNGGAKKGTGVAGIDPISLGLSAISSIFGGHKSKPAPDEPRHWMTVIATGVPYETDVSGGVRHYYWNGQTFVSDPGAVVGTPSEGAMKMKSAMNAAGATPAKPLGNTPSPSANIPPATVASQAASGFSSISLSNPLVIGALVIGGFFVVRSLRRRR